MIANRIKPVLVAAALFASLASAANARDGWSDRDSSVYRLGSNRWEHRDDRTSNVESFRVFYTGTASFVRRLGIFSGPLQARPVPDFGIHFARYFSQDYWWGQEGGVVLAPKAKIIDVDSGLRGYGIGHACAYEAGVCVIRGGN
ncbi:hypothetical protein J2T08_005303 [Neorhizobium galegae]|uniref:hypothetical protein n=1 Tax=Neorhizobium galegae TaxID=399 RepID=UPI00277F8B15|nr:hypothetical protein [Neorhizobium galegae]MDQ0137364.1 hypothetical protein [Neorhizobium galegae]